MSKAGIPTRHRLTRSYNIGRGPAWMQAKCTCGWISTKHYESDNNHLPEAHREEAQHLADAELLIEQGEHE